MKLATLKRRAATAARARGHKLGAWTDYEGGRASAFCLDCGKEAYVVENPAANEIDVSGEAVALNCSVGSGRRIKITYDTVTPESAEIGDYADSGWIDEEGVCADPDGYDIAEAGSEVAAVVEKAVSIIGNGVEASDYPTCCPGHTWYTDADGDTDYSDGSETRQSYHLEGFSEEEERAIYAELTGK